MRGLVICWVVIDSSADISVRTLSARFACSSVNIFFLSSLFSGNIVRIFHV